MKNNLKFYFVTLFLIASDFVVFAQGGPGDDDGGGGLEGGDPQPAPINSKLILLAITGVLFVIYTYRKNKRTV
ncbi:signal peptidase [Flavobacterium terrisoli]|uniref:signal peptidase n=1 Tax=Flavobacterium terrisoli TaxID=3242195 RepID=UPI002543ECC3|nr:signal peptidase [Flavobacterium buctense]